MNALRHPQTGCPWDIKQSIASIAPYTLEEAYEVVDAIEKDDFSGLKSELGDLLYHIVFYSKIASELGEFDFNDVVNSISTKLISRHPHVFSKTNQQNRLSDSELESLWEKAKASERNSQSVSDTAPILNGVAKALPALKRAQKLQKRAATEGFDWQSIEPVFKKIEEEINELREAIASDNQGDIFEEMGDLVFSCVNLSRHLNVDVEEATRACNEKFICRFNYIEKILKQDRREIKDCELIELENLWLEAKKHTA